MTAALLLGLDIGTSGAKAVLVDSEGRLLAAAGREYPLRIPQPGWAEQDPADWLKAGLSVLRQVLDESGADAQQIAGLGLTGQMHSLVCLGAGGEVLRPAITWADQRAQPQVARLTAEPGRARLAELAGNPLAAGFMAGSWAWLKDHEPHTVAATRWLLLPKDEVRYRLTGQIGSEPSDASSTLLFDPHTRRWSSELCAAVGLEPDRLPPLGESTGVAGGLLPEMAHALGLPVDLPVVYGGSDQACQAFAQGMITPGQVSCTIGTGGQIFAPLDAPRHDAHLRLHLFCHVLPRRWHLEAAILTAGMALRWLRDNVWPGSSYSQLADAAGASEAALDGLFFAPYLAGERTPYMDASARAAWVGLELRHGQPHMVRAVMEGVVFALRQGLQLVDEIAGTGGEVILSGGAAAHPLWQQLAADIFGRPVVLSSLPEATARGAALLAGLGCGVFASPQDTVAGLLTEPRRTLQPNFRRAEAYSRAFEQYRRLYAAVKQVAG